MEDHDQAEPTKRTEAILCGRVFGTNAGWDQLDTFALILYKFQPNASAAVAGLPAGDLECNFEDGSLHVLDDNTNEICWSGDLVSVLNLLPLVGE